ncbi:L-2-hydroxyglutarate oxidase [Aliiglaciecola sp. M165]|uniref:L-2-hydroxyglutarate oxidase n=1 Tax=Aliiglaciecola sp. M165 TaxID=2593649 RepID=UPI0011813B25|nr:L-2-hydroxyglutarate oxidase [Aliiglaciecola sp. M165]TRY32481.1 L-2-hydroxyglutarate oxidase [Aliiglaciecola sp. M165]
MNNYDVAIVGAGIVGAATALELKKRFPNKNVVILEKELAAATHQTGRNSGVIHAGVYYQPGSLKARFCKEGLQKTIAYCQKNSLPYEQCGKLIVATNKLEVERLQKLYDRCERNDLTPKRVSQRELSTISPDIQGLEAILINQTGITDYQRITKALIDEFTLLGGQRYLGFKVSDIEIGSKGIVLSDGEKRISARYLINCSGVMTDNISKSCGLDIDYKIIPFKGEYFVLPERFNTRLPHLIYPVPDPDLPFLGVHLTKMIDGSVTVGPNAVLAAGKESYGKFDVNIKDCMEMFAFKGFWRLLNAHKRSVLEELRTSVSKERYLKAVQKYCPTVKSSDLLPYRSGIRAQAVSLQGDLIHDFKFINNEFSLHVCNAPSPAATSAMPIANEIVDRYENYC